MRTALIDESLFKLSINTSCSHTPSQLISTDFPRASRTPLMTDLWQFFSTKIFSFSSNTLIILATIPDVEPLTRYIDDFACEKRARLFLPSAIILFEWYKSSVSDNSVTSIVKIFSRKSFMSSNILPL